MEEEKIIQISSFIDEEGYEGLYMLTNVGVVYKKWWDGENWSKRVFCTTEELMPLDED